MSVDLVKLGAQMGGVALTVVAVLLAMSLYSASVAIERLVAYRRARRQSMAFVGVATRFWEEDRVHELVLGARSYTRSHLARVVSAGLAEYQKKLRIEGLSHDQLLEATRRASERAAILAAADFRRGIGALGTIGATAPFVGLFGTVVGIINAFAAMGKAGTGGIETVSAGIAEALVTTALGLLVALPAVWLYNHFLRQVEAFQVEMDNSASELVDRLLECAPERATAVR
ncbi:MAG TPA: MotA/TolQ/ExbB proton channel family protein [Thermoanaerobaculaceae bacterium]|nr:MotA/TolQ/ExbB proton channel family protein [Thermoanaerobaculaceae bacterium]HRS15436.1 MotA/TolQ/ExbB proton channel family protein [Thermoanaerobaculaceae bacterium]